MNYEPLLPGIAIEGYRSFSTWQKFEFPSKVTVLAGINNSGKSNVLRFLQEILPKLRSPHGQRPPVLIMSDLDRPRGFSAQQRVRIGYPIYTSPLDQRKDPTLNKGHIHPHELLDYIDAAMSLLTVDDIYWSTLELRGNLWTTPIEQAKAAVDKWPNWSSHTETVLKAMGGGFTNPIDVMAELLFRVGGFHNLPKVATINSARRVENTQDDGRTDWLSGQGIIMRLAALQNPPHGQREWTEGRKRWSEINQFIQNVLVRQPPFGV